ncbi:MAG: type II toxin-antitoxin system RelE/ParE family toxin [Bacillota bacterium]
MDSKYSWTKKLERLLKRIGRKSKKLTNSFYAQADLILQNPKAGALLKGDLKGYRSWDYNPDGIAVRICCLYDELENIVHFVYFGTRENFYDEVKRYLL